MCRNWYQYRGTGDRLEGYEITWSTSESRCFLKKSKTIQPGKSVCAGRGFDDLLVDEEVPAVIVWKAARGKA
jgi:hypothetical protein